MSPVSYLVDSAFVDPSSKHTCNMHWQIVYGLLHHPSKQRAYRIVQSIRRSHQKCRGHGVASSVSIANDAGIRPTAQQLSTVASMGILVIVAGRCCNLVLLAPTNE